MDTNAGTVKSVYLYRRRSVVLHTCMEEVETLYWAPENHIQMWLPPCLEHFTPGAITRAHTYTPTHTHTVASLSSV